MNTLAYKHILVVNIIIGLLSPLDMKAGNPQTASWKSDGAQVFGCNVWTATARHDSDQGIGLSTKA